MSLQIKPYQVERCVGQLVNLLNKAYPTPGEVELPSIQLFADRSGNVSGWIGMPGMKTQVFNFTSIPELVAHLQKQAGEDVSQ